MQVLANGAPFTLAALAFAMTSMPPFAVLGAGALAAAASDTWGTEVGTLVGGVPRSIITGRPVAPGISGGVTWVGTLASVFGAAVIAGSAVVLGWPRRLALMAFVGGVVGSLTDSLIGGTIQARRWCDACGVSTERAVHGCGRTTRHAGGVRWMDNDWVNVVSGTTGALAALGVGVALRAV
jgi:uncharacterized protein (TIGR00297 family)